MSQEVDTLTVLGVALYSIRWWQVHRKSLLLASPTADTAAASARNLRRVRAENDVDFVLFGPSTDVTADKIPTVDYSFLHCRPRPALEVEETVATREQKLKHWMEESYIAYHQKTFLRQLQQLSPQLCHEYEWCQANLHGQGGSRAVRGVVVPPSGDQNGGSSTVVVSLPLLASHAEKIYQSVSNLAALYAKVMRVPWKPSYQLSSVDMSLLLTYRISTRDQTYSVLSEQPMVQIEDLSTTGTHAIVEMLHTCINVADLPSYADAWRHGATIGEFLPQLEKVMYERVRQPLHFMKLVLGLTADLGEPLEVCMSCKDLCSSGDAAGKSAPSTAQLLQLASFCVVDRATGFCFMIRLQYHSGFELPSVHVVSSQLVRAADDSLLRAKVQYPKETAPLHRDVDGFLDVEEVRVLVVRGVFESMASLSAACR